MNANEDVELVHAEIRAESKEQRYGRAWEEEEHGRDNKTCKGQGRVRL